MRGEDIISFAKQLGLSHSKAGDNIMMSCPNSSHFTHGGTDRRPSFGVQINDTKPSKCKCFTCGIRGTFSVVVSWLCKQDIIPRDVAEFVQRVDKGTVDSWRKLLEESKNTYFRKEEQKPDFHKICMRGGDQAYSYLEKRGFTRKEVDRYSLGFYPGGREFSFPLVTYPLLNQNDEIKGVWGRNVLPNPLVKSVTFPGTDEHSYFGEQFVDNTLGKVFLVEGALDVIKTSRVVDNVLGMGGLNVNRKKAIRLKSFCRCVVYVPDGDAAGIGSVDKNCSLFKKVGLSVRVALLPSGKDPADLDRQELLKIISKPKIFTV